MAMIMNVEWVSEAKEDVNVNSKDVDSYLGVSLVIIADKSKSTASPRFSLNRKVNVANVSILLE